MYLPQHSGSRQITLLHNKHLHDQVPQLDSVCVLRSLEYVWARLVLVLVMDRKNEWWMKYLYSIFYILLKDGTGSCDRLLRATRYHLIFLETLFHPLESSVEVVSSSDHCYHGDTGWVRITCCTTLNNHQSEVTGLVNTISENVNCHPRILLHIAINTLWTLF